MIGDRARTEVIEKTLSTQWVARNAVDLRSIPVDFSSDYWHNKNVVLTTFEFRVMYKPSARATKKPKPYMIVFDQDYPFRFQGMEDLPELAAKHPEVAFLLKWGEPITQELLDTVKRNNLRAQLMPYSRVMAYDKYLRDYVEKETGHRPPPEKSMLIDDGLREAVLDFQNKRNELAEKTRVWKNNEWNKLHRLNQKILNGEKEVTEG